MELKDHGQDISIQKQETEILDHAESNGFPEVHWNELQGILWFHIAELSTRSNCTAKKIDPLCIELKSNNRPVLVKPRNYSAV